MIIAVPGDIFAKADEVAFAIEAGARDVIVAALLAERTRCEERALGLHNHVSVLPG